MKITIKKLEKSEVEILGVLPVADFEKYEEKALNIISERVELPGFRKGKAPIAMIKENVKEMELLEEMAEQALYDNYPKILQENKIDAIGRPQIAITKIAKGSDLEFKILTAVLPEIKLPDYKKIAKEKNSSNDFKKEIVVDEAMVEKTILDLRKMRAEQAQHKDHEHVPARPHDVSGAGGKGETHVEIPESEYPAFDDAFAKTFGDFASAEALKEKIRANLKIEKETEQKDKLRLAIVEELLKQSECEIPEILIDSEVEKIFYRLEADITNMGFKFDEYLIQIKKTEEDLRKEWRPEAEKRAKLQMIIQTISEKENLKATEEEIEKEVNNIVTIYKDADPARARAYVEQMLENEKVFAFLEKQ